MTRRLLLSTLVVWLAAFGVLRVSFLAPEVCPSVDDRDAVGAAVRAADWIAAGQRADGRYLYEYDRDRDHTSPGYNIVRHAGVTLSLYQLAVAGHRGGMAVADDGLEVMLNGLVRAGDGLALTSSGTRIAQLGASALMAAALEARRDGTGDRRYDDELRALGRFMAGQIGPDGQALDSFDLERDAPVPGHTSKYATGEAGWALALLDTLFPGEGWDRPARAVADYLATERDVREGFDFRPWPDQWASYLLAELAPRGLDRAQVAYARSLAERFGMLVRAESQKGTWPTKIVARRARGAGLGVWVEGLGSLERVAAIDDRLADLRPAISDRVACGAGLLAQRQVDDDHARRFAKPELVEGAWFRDGVTRMDDQQHALSALLAAAGLVGAPPP